MAITGAVIIMSSFYFMHSWIYEINEKLLNVSKESAMLEVNIEFSKIKTEKIRNLIEISIKQKNGEYIKDKSKLSLLYSDDEIKKLVNEQHGNEHSLKNDLAKFNANLNRVSYYTKEIRSYYTIFSFLIFIGASISYLGFMLWYTKVQKPQDTMIGYKGEAE